MAQILSSHAMKQVDPYLEQFDRFAQSAKQPSWLFPLRKAGMTSFADTGFPTVQDEDWRFTNVAPISKLPFRPALIPSKDRLSRQDIAALTFGGLRAHRLVFVDGHYSADLSSPLLQEQGVVAGSLAQALAEQPALLEKHLSRYAQANSDAFAALNTAFFQDGGFILVPRGKILETPIHLLFISDASEPGSTSHPRNLIITS